MTVFVDLTTVTWGQTDLYNTSDFQKNLWYGKVCRKRCSFALDFCSQPLQKPETTMLILHAVYVRFHFPKINTSGRLFSSLSFHLESNLKFFEMLRHTQRFYNMARLESPLSSPFLTAHKVSIFDGEFERVRIWVPIESPLRKYL